MAMEIIEAGTVEDAAAAEVFQAEHDPYFAASVAVASQVRWGAAEDLRKLRQLTVTAPTLPDAAIAETFDRVVEAEQDLIAPNRLSAEYVPGTAKQDDALFVTDETGPVLMEAQHASSLIRKATGRLGDPDHGTAGLAMIMAEDGLGRAIIPRGRQTGNANVDAQHPIKDELVRQLQTADYRGFLSVHGMRPGKTVSLLDDSEVHAIIGLGKKPTEASIAVAEKIVHSMREAFGLRVLIGNQTPHVNFQKDPAWDGQGFRDADERLERRDDGRPKAVRLAALGANSTTNFMKQQFAERNLALPAVQVEMSRSLRLLPKDRWVRRDPQAERVGVYLGYQLMAAAAEICGNYDAR